MKTLGVLWLANDDVFTYKSHDSERLITPTKKSFLKLIATLLDFCLHNIVRAKILMQEIWIGGRDWDDTLPEEITAKVMSWLSELPMLSKIKVPRSLQSSGKAKSVLLHVFVDASQDAYRAVVYMRIEYDDRRTSVSFVISKTKVTPLQVTSIPHLELMGAVIGKRLALSVAGTLNVEKQSITFWPDR